MPSWNADRCAVRSDPDVRAFLLDLDGTLVGSVYRHVLAWREATHAADIELPVWRIHHQIGMSGGVMLSALLREAGRTLSEKEARHFQLVHRDVHARQAPSLRVLPGTHDLLATWAGHSHSVCHLDERPPGERSPHAELDRTYAERDENSLTRIDGRRLSRHVVC